MGIASAVLPPSLILSLRPPSILAYKVKVTYTALRRTIALAS